MSTSPRLHDVLPIAPAEVSASIDAEVRARTEWAPRRDATLVTAFLAAGIFLGSGQLAHFDFALTGYCLATLIACFATTYQISTFWRRPPSAMYGRELLRAVRRISQVRHLLRSAGRDIAAQRFIARRSRVRWLAHMALAWGTLIGFTVTLPLVWGWLDFETDGDRIYRVMFWSLPVARLATDGVLAWLLFNALNLAAAAVVFGAGYFLTARVRLRREPGVTGRFHLGPLFLLLMVALTGLALPVVAAAEPGWFRIASLAHEFSVVTLLVSLPYGKLIHLFVRPLHLGAQLARATSVHSAACQNCAAAMAPAAQVQTVEALLSARGFHFGGYQQLCPACRRRQLATVHSHLLGEQFQPKPAMNRASVRTAA